MALDKKDRSDGHDTDKGEDRQKHDTMGSRKLEKNGKSKIPEAAELADACQASTKTETRDEITMTIS